MIKDEAVERLHSSISKIGRWGKPTWCGILLEEFSKEDIILMVTTLLDKENEFSLE